jgi:hypothetical protein
MPEILDEWIDPDALYWKRRLVLEIELTPALGFAEIDPVRRFVTGSTKARNFDKGFEQRRTVSVA